MKRLLAVIALVSSCASQASDWENSPEVGRLFSKAGVNGTFVLYDVSARRFVGHDPIRADQRFIPASTFKIPNSLIGLSSGAVHSVDEVLPYGGKPQPYKAWEQDMCLREAIAVSNVPVYQELARRIGLERMSEGVARMGFGNAQIGGVADRFWLDGPLAISAVEQTRFLARLARDELPFPKAAQAAVREIIRLERGDGWALYGKTGWADIPQPDIGWWVGWVEKGSDLYVFALNIDMPQATDAAKRIELGKASLRVLGVLGDGKSRSGT